MRITKKYAGDSSLGKKVFNWRSEVYTSTELAQLSELQFLEGQFHLRLQAKGQKLKPSEFVSAVVDGTAQKMQHQQHRALSAASKASLEAASTGGGMGWAKAMPDYLLDPTSIAATSTSFSSLDVKPSTMMRVMSAPNLMQQLGADASNIFLPGSPQSAMLSSRDKHVVFRPRSNSINRNASGVTDAAAGGMGSSSSSVAAMASAEEHSDYKLEHVAYKFEQEAGYHLQNGALLTCNSSSSSAGGSGSNHLLSMSPPSSRGMPHKAGAGTGLGVRFYPNQQQQLHMQNQLLFAGAPQPSGAGGMMLPGSGSSSTSLQMSMRPVGHMSLGQGLKRSRSVSDIERVVELERLAEDDEAAGDLFLDFVSKIACRRPSIVDA